MQSCLATATKNKRKREANQVTPRNPEECLVRVGGSRQKWNFRQAIRSSFRQHDRRRRSCWVAPSFDQALAVCAGKRSPRPRPREDRLLPGGIARMTLGFGTLNSRNDAYKSVGADVKSSKDNARTECDGRWKGGRVTVSNRALITL